MLNLAKSRTLINKHAYLPMISSFKKSLPVGGHCLVVSVIASTRYAADFVGKIMEFFAVPSVTKIVQKMFLTCLQFCATYTLNKIIELSKIKSVAAPTRSQSRQNCQRKLHKITYPESGFEKALLWHPFNQDIHNMERGRASFLFISDYKSYFIKFISQTWITKLSSTSIK